MARPMTLTEKLLARGAHKNEVSAGQFVNVRLDLVMANDITAPLAMEAFEASGATTVFDRERVALVPSHSAPARDIKSAELIQRMREFARKHEITHFFETGRGGVEHVVLPEEGIVVPGDVVLGADSHTCTYGAVGAFSTGVGSTDLGCAIALGETWLRVPDTMRFVFRGTRGKYVTGKDLILYTIGQIGCDGARYRAMEFAGEVIASLPMHDRLTMCNMAIEAGGKNGVVPPDEITRAYEAGRAKREPVYFQPDPDAAYLSTHEWDVTEMEPQISYPFNPENAKPLSEAKGEEIDQVFIGSCTNGRLEDLRIAADILRGRKVHPRIRTIVLPGSDRVYREALKEGLIEVFAESGASVGPATCGPCLGGHMGVLGPGERCAATSNRNFVGRMGHKSSRAYLVNPYVAASAAVTGFICGPDDLD
jgi:3-isopropylmalate/(R)-2-methylmalate dehydratase large subunit